MGAFSATTIEREGTIVGNWLGSSQDQDCVRVW